MKLASTCWVILLGFMVAATPLSAQDIPSSQRSRSAIARMAPHLKGQLTEKHLDYGAPVFIRIFKKPRLLELWVQNRQASFSLFKTYRICNFSGHLGPKLRRGDFQSPEGFYFVTPGRLNPWSQFHLSFNLGYPNTYDRHHGRTGSALMVHGNCVSIGCYAMTNRYIDEIYTLINAAFEKGQPFFRVHIFPFALTPEKLHVYKGHRWYDFWVNLKEGYDAFESRKIPPNVEVRAGRYVFAGR